jgi:hypothetical protein
MSILPSTAATLIFLFPSAVPQAYVTKHCSGGMLEEK